MGAWFLHSAGQGIQIAPFLSCQLLHCNKHFIYWLNKNNSMFKIFVTVDKHQGFKSFYQSNNIYQAWTFVQQCGKFVSTVISKLMNMFSNYGLQLSASQHSIVQLLNEMNSDANIVVHLSIGTKVNGQQNLGFIEFCFTSIWWIMVDMLVISFVKGHGRPQGCKTDILP